ncbi:hypothetical protein HDU76_007595 [Blyttiomyces sp. JEL0837]|nr:hypothetical protein HDU76_007595 [Blyttiomyces sp. JEL0837]
MDRPYRAANVIGWEKRPDDSPSTNAGNSTSASGPTNTTTTTTATAATSSNPSSASSSKDSKDSNNAGSKYNYIIRVTPTTSSSSKSTSPSSPSSKPLPYIIRRTYDDFVDFNSALTTYIKSLGTPRTNADVATLFKKGSSSSGFLQLPKRRMFVTRAVNEERVTLLDLYIQDLLTMSNAVLSSNVVRAFFEPSMGDVVAAEKEFAKSAKRSGSGTGGKKGEKAVMRRDWLPEWMLPVGRKVPNQNVGVLDTSNGGLLSGASDEVPLDEPWLQPVEERRRLSKLVTEAEMIEAMKRERVKAEKENRTGGGSGGSSGLKTVGSMPKLSDKSGAPISPPQIRSTGSLDSRRDDHRISLLPPLQTGGLLMDALANDFAFDSKGANASAEKQKPGKAVKSSALKHVINRMYDEAAKNRPRERVMVRAFNVASAITDAETVIFAGGLSGGADAEAPDMPSRQKTGDDPAENPLMGRYLSISSSTRGASKHDQQPSTSSPSKGKAPAQPTTNDFRQAPPNLYNRPTKAGPMPSRAVTNPGSSTAPNVTRQMTTPYKITKLPPPQPQQSTKPSRSDKVNTSAIPGPSKPTIPTSSSNAIANNPTSSQSKSKPDRSLPVPETPQYVTSPSTPSPTPPKKSRALPTPIPTADIVNTFPSSPSPNPSTSTSKINNRSLPPPPPPPHSASTIVSSVPSLPLPPPPTDDMTEDRPPSVPPPNVPSKDLKDPSIKRTQSQKGGRISPKVDQVVIPTTIGPRSSSRTNTPELADAGIPIRSSLDSIGRSGSRGGESRKVPQDKAVGGSNINNNAAAATPNSASPSPFDRFGRGGKVLVMDGNIVESDETVPENINPDYVRTDSVDSQRPSPFDRPGKGGKVLVLNGNILEQEEPVQVQQQQSVSQPTQQAPATPNAPVTFTSLFAKLAGYQQTEAASSAPGKGELGIETGNGDGSNQHQQYESGSSRRKSMAPTLLTTATGLDDDGIAFDTLSNASAPLIDEGNFWLPSGAQQKATAAANAHAVNNATLESRKSRRSRTSGVSTSTGYPVIPSRTTSTTQVAAHLEKASVTSAWVDSVSSVSGRPSSAGSLDDIVANSNVNGGASVVTGVSELGSLRRSRTLPSGDRISQLQASSRRVRDNRHDSVFASVDDVGDEAIEGYEETDGETGWESSTSRESRKKRVVDAAEEERELDARRMEMRKGLMRNGGDAGSLPDVFATSSPRPSNDVPGSPAPNSAPVLSTNNSTAKAPKTKMSFRELMRNTLSRASRKNKSEKDSSASPSPTPSKEAPGSAPLPAPALQTMRSNEDISYGGRQQQQQQQIQQMQQMQQQSVPIARTLSKSQSFGDLRSSPTTTAPPDDVVAPWNRFSRNRTLRQQRSANQLDGGARERRRQNLLNVFGGASKDAVVKDNESDGRRSPVQATSPRDDNKKGYNMEISGPAHLESPWMPSPRRPGSPRRVGSFDNENLPYSSRPSSPLVAGLSSRSPSPTPGSPSRRRARDLAQTPTPPGSPPPSLPNSASVATNFIGVPFERQNSLNRSRSGNLGDGGMAPARSTSLRRKSERRNNNYGDETTDGETTDGYGGSGRNYGRYRSEDEKTYGYDEDHDEEENDLFGVPRSLSPRSAEIARAVAGSSPLSAGGRVGRSATLNGSSLPYNSSGLRHANSVRSPSSSRASRGFNEDYNKRQSIGGVGSGGAGGKRRSQLLRSHTISGGGRGSEVEKHFVQIKAVVGENTVVAVKVSRNITFAALIERLTTKAEGALGANAGVIESLMYVDAEGCRVIVADEEDWGVCLSDVTAGKLTVTVIYG